MINPDEIDKLDRIKQVIKLIKELDQSNQSTELIKRWINDNFTEILETLFFANKYFIHETVPRGLNFTSYIAQDVLTKESVEIFLIQSGDFAKKNSCPVSFSTIFRESMLRYKLRHPNIREYYDSGITNDGLVYIVFKHEESNTLKQSIQYYKKIGKISYFFIIFNSNKNNVFIIITQ